MGHQHLVSCCSFALFCCPLRFNLHASRASCGVVEKAAPLPILRTRAQSAVHGIAVDVAQLFCELAVMADVEIVVALLPEVLRLANQASRHALFQRFERIGERPMPRFAEEQVNVLRHDDVSVDAQIEAAPDTLECELENLLRRILGKGWTTVVATERHKVALSGFLISR